MIVEKRRLLDGATSARGMCVLIDVFRAFSTACFVMDAIPQEYLLVGDSGTASTLGALKPRPFLIGKPEQGAKLCYDVPNSPTRALMQRHRLSGATIIHRTQAGARGVLCATSADELITGSLANANAIARYIRTQQPSLITLVALGHEGNTPSHEDDLCADYIAALINGTIPDITQGLDMLRQGAGKYFFTDAQDEYPRSDFAYCTDIDRFSFVLRGERHNDHVRLLRIDV